MSFRLRSRLFRVCTMLLSGVIVLAGLRTAAADVASVRVSADAGQSPVIVAGQRLYRNGTLPSGAKLSGFIQSDVPLRGEQLICENCHGRSGMGSTEGTIITPAITGSVLFSPEEIVRKELYASRTVRPAYTDATLKRAIRDGIDASGAALDETMPRYAISDADFDVLNAYLKTLSAQLSPGVDDTTIHFATVLTDGIDPVRRNALLEVLTTFIDDKNAGTRQEIRRAEHAPFHKAWRYESYRRWELHVWDLRGPADTWSAQLQSYYTEQPVFAMISGLGTGSWEPVHEFCNKNSMPCVLPNTDLPVISDSDYYSLYFSKGMTLTAETVAKHLRDAAIESTPVIQVFRDDARAAVAATTLRQILETDGFEKLQDRRVANDEAITATFWETLLKGNRSAALVLWLEEKDLPGINTLAELDKGPARIYVSSVLNQDAPSHLGDGLREKTVLIHPYNLPADSAGRLQRNNVWFRNKGIEVVDDQLQINTLFAAMLVSQALKHIGSNFYRDYFLEKVEHIVDKMAWLASYPNLSLARNQRYASKGSYAAVIVENSDGEIALEGEWIVP